MSQLWKSPLNQGLHPAVEKLNRSLHRDARLWKEDIRGSIAHVKMLVEAKLISAPEGEKLLDGLTEIEKEILKGSLTPHSPKVSGFHETPNIYDEDIHSWIERELVERLGPSGSNIHIARSRNEQVLLDTKLYLRSMIEIILENLTISINQLKTLEIQAEATILPSYTHLRRAQPLYLKEYWEAHRIYWEETLDGFQWIQKNLNEECPMGAGAIHGTTLPTLPDYEAKLLGFKRSPKNSLATVSNRSWILNFLSQSTHWLLNLSRLMEDLINFSTEEFGFFSLGHSVTTGSSMMPQKRNPDLCELIRGKSASALGHYVAMMTLMKGLPMGYMKDLQEDKVHLFAVVDIVLEVLETLPILLSSIQVHSQSMEEACSDPQLLATDLMEHLVRQGVPLREAHLKLAQWVKEEKSVKSFFTENSYNLNLPKLLPELSPELLTPTPLDYAKASCEKRYQGIQQALQRNQPYGDKASNQDLNLDKGP